MLPRKKVILCADDYGISPGVNRAINQLAQTIESAPPALWYVLITGESKLID